MPQVWCHRVVVDHCITEKKMWQSIDKCTVVSPRKVVWEWRCFLTNLWPDQTESCLVWIRILIKSWPILFHGCQVDSLTMAGPSWGASDSCIGKTLLKEGQIETDLGRSTGVPLPLLPLPPLHLLYSISILSHLPHPHPAPPGNRAFLALCQNKLMTRN